MIIRLLSGPEKILVALLRRRTALEKFYKQQRQRGGNVGGIMRLLSTKNATQSMSYKRNVIPPATIFPI
jgi:hypothetical protein